MLSRHVDWRGQADWKQKPEDAAYFQQHPVSLNASHGSDERRAASLHRPRPTCFTLKRGKPSMLKKPNCPVIALEEHYLGRGIGEDLHRARTRGARARRSKRLHDLGALRLKEMDEGGIDIQVLSHGAPSTQKLAQGHRGRPDAAGQ